jgi:hypothetical protein
VSSMPAKVCAKKSKSTNVSYRVDNIDDEMVSGSIHELQTICPGEGFEVRSDCADDAE